MPIFITAIAVAGYVFGVAHGRIFQRAAGVATAASLPDPDVYDQAADLAQTSRES